MPVTPVTAVRFLILPIFFILKKFSINQLLNIWVRRNKCDWLSIIAYVLVKRAGAVVLKGKTVVVYESKEPLKIPIPRKNLEQLQKALTDKRKELCLSFD